MCCACVPLLAQEIPVPLTLEHCFRLALDQNPSLKATEAEVEGSRAALAGQRGRRLPQLNAEWNWRTQEYLSGYLELDGVEIPTASRRSTRRDLSLTLRQTFFQSGLTESISAAKAQVTASHYSREDAERRLLLEVAASFYTVLADLELARVAQEAEESAQRYLEMVEARIDAGTAAPVDRLPVESELAAAHLQVVRTVNATWQAIADLRQLLGLDPQVLPMFEGELGKVPAPGPLEAWLQEALASRPDLRAQAAQVRRAQLALTQARLAAGLSLSAVGEFEHGRHSSTTGESWWLGLGASFPLYSQQARAEVRSAKAAEAAAQHRLAALELQVQREATQAWYALKDATERVAAAGVSVQAAQAYREAARERYTEGLAIIIEVTDAELALQQAQADLVQAQYDEVVAHYQLLAAAGRSLQAEVGEGHTAALGATQP